MGDATPVVTLRLAFATEPSAAAVRLALRSPVTPAVEIEKVAEVWPAGIVTVGGTWTAAWLLVRLIV